MPFAALTFVVTVATVGKTTRLLVGLTYILRDGCRESARALARVQAKRGGAAESDAKAVASRRSPRKTTRIPSPRSSSRVALFVLKPFWSPVIISVFFYQIAVVLNSANAEVARRGFTARIADGSIPKPNRWCSRTRFWR